MRKLGFLFCEYDAEEGEDDVGFERLVDEAEVVAFTVDLKRLEMDLNGGCGGGGREGRFKDETDAERVSMADDKMKLKLSKRPYSKFTHNKHLSVLYFCPISYILISHRKFLPVSHPFLWKYLNLRILRSS